MVGLHEADTDVGLLSFSQRHFGNAESHSSIARVEHIYRVSVDVGQFLGTGTVVVAVEDDVEAGHVQGHPFRCVLATKRMVFGKVLNLRLVARVEEPHHQVGMLFLLDDFHPFFGSGFQLFETQPRTKAVGYPGDDIRCS